mgnify:CR=1 FL=1
MVMHILFLQVVNLNPQYVKRVGPDGSVEHLDWHKHYDLMRETAGYPKPGRTNNHPSCAQFCPVLMCSESRESKNCLLCPIVFFYQ